MTINELIEKLKYDNELCFNNNGNVCFGVKDGKCTCNDANIVYILEELQQYREIGTVEECRIYKDLCSQSNLADISEYREIGTVDECQEAMEKQRALKPQEVLLYNGRSGFECKNCGNELSTNPFESTYCHWCGQRLE